MQIAKYLIVLIVVWTINLMWVLLLIQLHTRYLSTCILQPRQNSYLSCEWDQSWWCSEGARGLPGRDTLQAWLWSWMLTASVSALLLHWRHLGSRHPPRSHRDCLGCQTGHRKQTGNQYQRSWWELLVRLFAFSENLLKIALNPENLAGNACMFNVYQSINRWRQGDVNSPSLRRIHHWLAWHLTTCTSNQFVTLDNTAPAAVLNYIFTRSA